MNSKEYFFLLLSFLISAFILSISFGKIQYSEPWSNLMASGIEKHLIFGKDIILPQGPLSFLLRNPTSTFPYWIVLFDLFVLMNLTFIFYKISSRTKLSVLIRVTLAALIIVIAIPSIQLGLFLLWIFLFLLFEYLETRSFLVLASATLVAVVIFYVQLDLGLVSFFYLATFMFYFFFSGILGYIRVLLLVGTYIISVYLLSYPLSTEVLSYVVNGFSVSTAYADNIPMALAGSSAWTDVLIAVAFIAMLIIAYFAHLKYGVSDRRTAFVYLVVITYLFFLFKNGFSGGASNQFFVFAIPALSLLVFFAREGREAIFNYLVLPITLMTLIVVLGNNNLGAHFSDVYNFEKIKSRYEAGASTTESGAPTDGSVIEPDILAAIAGRTVDIMLPELSNISNSNYQTRPMPLPSLAKTERLNKLNGKFISARGAQLVLMNYTSAENRYPFFEEAATKLELLRKYKVKMVAASGKQVLLERLPLPNSYRGDLLDEKEFNLNDEIKTETSEEIQIAYPQIEYSWLGEIFKFFFWSPELNVTLTLIDNSVHTFGYDNSQGSGLIVNKFVAPGDNKGFQFFFDHFGRLTRSVTSIMFSSKSEWAFRKNSVLVTELVKFEGREKEMDYSSKPLEASKTGDAAAAVYMRINFETFLIDKSRIDLFGWGFINDSTYKSLNVTVLFQSATQALVFPFLPRFHRPDVQQAFGRNVSDSSGFGGTIYRDFLKKEVYQVGVAFMDNKKIVKRIFGSAVLDNRDTSKTSSGPVYGYLLRKLTLTAEDREEKLLRNIEDLHLTSNQVTVAGWAGLADKPNKQLEPVQVLLKSKEGAVYAAPTVPLLRTDVSDYLKNVAMDSSGFRSVFVTDSLKRGYYDLGLFIKHRAGGGRYEFIQQVAVGFPEQFSLTSFGKPVTESTMNFGIDRLESSSRTITISGWAFDPSSKSIQHEVNILLRSDDGAIYVSETKMVQRPDVTTYFENKRNLDESGFEAVISKSGLLKGRYEIGILLWGDSSNDYKVQFSGEFINKSRFYGLKSQPEVLSEKP